MSASAEQLAAIGRALGIEGEPTSPSIVTAIGARSAHDVAAALQAEGVAASVVADASDQVSDDHLWTRSFFGVQNLELPDLVGRFPQAGPVWGGGAPELQHPQDIGASTRAVLLEVGYDTAEVDALFADGVAVQSADRLPGRATPAASDALRLERRELSRIVPPEDVRALWEEVRGATEGAAS